MTIHLKFGGYQEPASVHNQAAGRFGELLKKKLGDRIRFELIGSVLKIGRGSGDLVPMVESGELSFCYMSTVRFSKAAPQLQLLELPSERVEHAEGVVHQVARRGVRRSRAA
jgi:TRAP-type C4-dicarboxylate transport system substrate-binding protein